jgi:hypothetical protein
MIIRPCPFCGEPKDIDVGCGTPDREGTPTWLYCGNCGANGPWAYCKNNDVGEPTKEWNVRTTDNVWAGKQIEALKATISRLLRYAYHEEECAVMTCCGDLPPCDCGYDDFMKELEESK